MTQPRHTWIVTLRGIPDKRTFELTFYLDAGRWSATIDYRPATDIKVLWFTVRVPLRHGWSDVHLQWTASSKPLPGFVPAGSRIWGFLSLREDFSGPEACLGVE